MKKVIFLLGLMGLFNSILLAKDFCREAVILAGGDLDYANGWCSKDNHSDIYWQCIIKAINDSNKKGYKNDDVSDVISYAHGWGSCENSESDLKIGKVSSKSIVCTSENTMKNALETSFRYFSYETDIEMNGNSYKGCYFVSNARFKILDELEGKIDNFYSYESEGKIYFIRKSNVIIE